jgi:hypothetical protein
MKKGDVVRYKTPASDFERIARFIVLDDPAEQIEAAVAAQKTHPAYRAKVDMQEICSLAFRPIRRTAIDEIEVCEAEQHCKKTGQPAH